MYMFKLLSKLQPYLGIIAIVYPALQAFAKSRFGYELPDFGDIGSVISQGVGTALVAKSEKI
jgi:hypothetical protein